MARLSSLTVFEMNWLRWQPTHDSWPANSSSRCLPSRWWHETQSNFSCSGILCENLSKLDVETLAVTGGKVFEPVIVTGMRGERSIQLARNKPRAARRNAAFSRVNLFPKPFITVSGAKPVSQIDRSPMCGNRCIGMSPVSHVIRSRRTIFALNGHSRLSRDTTNTKRLARLHPS